MLKREAEREIPDWINGSDRRCLLIDGVRQAGKTFIIRKALEESETEWAVSLSSFSPTSAF